MSIYADTSFFVSLYLTDQHTKAAEHLLASRPSLWITPLHIAEWVHAIELHVFRRVLTPDAAGRLIQQFEDHRSRGLWREAALPDLTWEVCARLARRHAGKLGVRALDTLHVASALELKAEQFWTFDMRQSRLADAAGLKTS